MSNIIDIELDKLEIHPKNVRKEYEGIDELAQSIKENGIMQNLTVVPDPEHKGKFFVVIGNRRLTAAKQAGIKTAPCIIAENMAERDQISTMLTENMNRKDLKVYEEAAAMQMCFSDYDFGLEELENKTGLSKTTINHRLNIAKLDSKILQEKASDEAFQLSLSDLYALEKIKSIETRDKVLRDSRDSKDLRWRINDAVRREIQKAHLLVFEKLLRNCKIKRATDKQKEETYSNKWAEVISYDIDANPPSKLKLPKDCDTSKMIWVERYSYLSIFVLASPEKSDTKEKTQEQLEREEQDRKNKKIREITKNIIKDMKDYVASYFEGRVDVRLSALEREDIDRKLWEVFKAIQWIGSESIVEGLIGSKWNEKNMTQEERNTAREDAKKLNLLDQKIAAAFGSMGRNECLVTWRGEYNKTDGDLFKLYYDVLTCFGYCYLDDEMSKVVDGTHEYYAKEETEK